MATPNLTEGDVQRAKEAIEVLGRIVSQSRSASPQVDQTSQPGPSSSANGAGGGTQPQKVLGLADNAMDMLQRMKAGIEAEKVRATKRKTSREEVHKLFNYAAPTKPKKPKISKAEWKHKFLCMAMRGQDRIPTTDTEKDDLLQAGLGEKEITFDDINVSAEAFRDILCDHYPQLKNAGGFQMCRCKPNSRDLEVLSTFAHSSPANLKQRVGNAKTYIRPIQKDLDLSVIFDLPDGPLEECLTCGSLLPLAELEEHVTECRRAYEEYRKQSKSMKEEDTKDSLENREVKQENLKDTARKHVIDVDALPEPPSPEFPQYLDTEEQLIENEFMRQALQDSLDVDRTNLGRYLSWKVKWDEDHLLLDVRRDCVLSDAMREAKKTKFCLEKAVKVTFVGEGAEDYGGPKREFFRLLSAEASNSLFIGHQSNKFFVMKAQALHGQYYKYLGQYTVMSITQGGCGMPFMAPCVFEYICTGKLSTVEIPSEYIPDPTLQFLVEKVESAENDTEIQVTCAIDEAQAMLLEAGFSKAFTRLRLADKSSVCSLLVNYHCMTKVKAAMDQYVEGLQSLGVLEEVRKDPEHWKVFFVDNKVKVDAAYLKEELAVEYSEKGSNFLPAERQTYIYFVDFLDECDDGTVQCTVEDVLVFTSGSNRIPPTGFQKKVSIKFIHDKERPLATSSTCDLALSLPACHEDYDIFKSFMILSFKDNDGFGGV